MTVFIPATDHPWRSGYGPKRPKAKRGTLSRVPFAYLLGRSAFKYRVLRRGGDALFTLKELADIMALDTCVVPLALYAPGKLILSKAGSRLRARIV